MITYQISYALLPAGPWIQTDILSAPSAVLTGLASGALYYVQLIPTDTVLGEQGPASVSGPFATTVLGESPNGTQLTTTVGIIVDQNFDQWALVQAPAYDVATGLQVLQPDGQVIGSNVLQLLYWAHAVYRQDTAWWQWTPGKVWQLTTDPRLLTGESVDGTSVADTTNVIYDANLDSWRLTAGLSSNYDVVHNGVIDPFTENTDGLLYSGHAVYRHSGASWYRWAPDGWVTATDPRQAESKNGDQVTDTVHTLIDANGDSWTLTGSGQVAHNGVVDSSTSGVTALLYWQHQVYRYGGGTWLVWTGHGWNVTTPPQESPSGTLLMAPADGTILDALMNSWQLTGTGYQILMNGSVDPVSASVIELLYSSHTLYQVAAATNALATGFKRASAATYTDPTGIVQTVGNDVLRYQTGTPLLEGLQTNFALYNQLIASAGWTITGVTVTRNFTTSPDGLLCAMLLREDASTGYHRIGIAPDTVRVGDVWTFSVYAKTQGARRNCTLSTDGETAAATFDMTSGTVSSSGGLACTIQPLANGWYRCAATWTKSTTDSMFWLNPFTNSGQYAGTNGAGIDLWGAQLELGALSSMIPTIDQPGIRQADVIAANALTGTTPGWWQWVATFTRPSPATFVDVYGAVNLVGNDVLRFEFGLPLIEPAATNYMRNSAVIGGSNWIVMATTVVMNARMAPDGTNTATLLTEDSTNAQHLIRQLPTGVTTVVGQYWTQSVFMRASNSTFGSMTSNGEGFASFDLINGVAARSSSCVAASMQYLADGWYRCSATWIKSNVNLTLYIGCSANTSVYLGTSTNSVYVWGAQMEPGFGRTSYIPTTATANGIRAADSAAPGWNPTTPLPSPDGTVLMSTGGAIVDNQFVSWRLVPGTAGFQVSMNGVPDGRTYGVIQLLFKNGFVYYQGTATNALGVSPGWWSWNGVSWIDVSSPI